MSDDSQLVWKLGTLWPCHGRESFRHFLVELGRDTDYLMGKLAGNRGNVYDADRTEKECRRELLERRKRRDIPKGVAREAWDDLAAVGCEEHELYQAVADSSALSEVWPYGEDIPVVRDHEIGLRRFVEVIWPVFVDQIRKEVSGG